MNPSVYSAEWVIFLNHNLYYIAVIIEVLLFTRYIFDTVIKTQLKYNKLKKISDKLKYNFQNKTSEIQEKERNKLLSNVHDSFGGYLEALKISLLSKSKKSPEKIQKILDAFYKEYRFLLNNLYSPKINSQNLIENLLTFCEKLNEITNDIIKPIFSLKETHLSPEKCLHIYRIISELTTNAIKHSKASEIRITVFNTIKDEIIIEVSDNGTGFINERKGKNSYGLQSIQNRITILKGVSEISSIKKKGTTITVKIPVNDN
jgi:signal transduction histidine kinase